MKFISKNKRLKKKQIILLILSLSIVALIIVLLTIIFSHHHSFGEWETVREASCTRYGIERRYCECGDVQERKQNMISHTESDWIYNKDKDQLNTVCTICNKILQINSLENHTHSWGEYSTHTAPTCTQSGLSVRNCECGATDEISIAPTGHNFGEWVIKSPAQCEINGSSECVCSNCQETQIKTIDALSHTAGSWIFANGEKQYPCIHCNDILYAEPVKESKNLDILNGKLIGIGTCENTEIVLPSTLHTIGEHSLEYQNITGILVPSSVTKIEKQALYQCSKLANIHLGDSLEIIESKAFFKCKSLQTVILPESLTILGEYAFYNCESLETVYIGANITQLNANVFGDCISLNTIYYNGTIAQWEAIQKNSQWDSGTPDYVVHCSDGDIQK